MLQVGRVAALGLEAKLDSSEEVLGDSLALRNEHTALDGFL